MADERIQGSMTIEDAILAICGGIPGAIVVCTELLAHWSKIDSRGFHEGFGPFLCLDSLNIYEGRIWGLWKDVCREDIVKMVAVLQINRFRTIAGIDKDALNWAIDNRGKGIDIDAVVEAVKVLNPNFNSAAIVS